MIKLPKQILSAFIITLLFVTSCNPLSDNNINRPEDVTADYTVSITGFTIDDTVVELGSSTVLRWEVKDQNLKVDQVFIDNGLGVQKALSGSKQVTPQKTTTYTLSVYVDGKVLYEKAARVTVITADGTEVKEAPGEEICDDDIDNDLDGKNNCDDADCAEFEACLNQEVIRKFDSVEIVTEQPQIGQPVTITWESNFELVTLGSPSISTEGTFAASDSFEFTPSVETTRITVYGHDLYGIRDSKTIEVVALPVEGIPEFDDETVTFTVSPSPYLIQGQKYTIYWDVKDALHCDMQGEEGCVNRSIETEATPGALQHSLEVEDVHGNIKTFTIDLVVSQIHSDKQSLDLSDVVDIQYTKEFGKYYIVTKSAVLFYDINGTEDNPKTIVEASQLEGEILSFAINKSSTFEDKYFIGTTHGVFKKKDDDSDPMLIVKNYDNDGFVWYHSAEIIVTSSKILLAGHGQDGVTSRIFEILKHSDDDGYRSQRFYISSISEHHVTDIVKSHYSNDRFTIISDKGIYLTGDGGQTFTALSLGNTNHIVKGQYVNRVRMTLWSDTQIYTYTSETNSILENNDFPPLANIRSVFCLNDYYCFSISDEGFMAYTKASDQQGAFMVDALGGADYKFMVRANGVKDTYDFETEEGEIEERTRVIHSQGLYLIDENFGFNYFGYGGDPYGLGLYIAN